jgi:hypothetical protein
MRSIAEGAAGAADAGAASSSLSLPLSGGGEAGGRTVSIAVASCNARIAGGTSRTRSLRRAHPSRSRHRLMVRSLIPQSVAIFVSVSSVFS